MILWRKRLPPRIIVPFSNLHYKTEESIKKHAPGAEYEYTPEGNDYIYRDVLQRHWTGESDLIVIEQDNEIDHRVIPAFTACKQPWCTFSYQGPPHMGYLYHAMGCVKFSAKLQRDYPFSNFNTPMMKWYNIDATIGDALRDDLGLIPHVHGHINHHHDYLSAESMAKSLMPFAHKELGGVILWHEEMNRDGRTVNICKERQPDGRTLIYYVNPDGTRGPFKREIPPMPRYKQPE